MQVFGEKELQPMCTINCKGKGPVISLNKELIDFGNVNLLTEVTYELEIISDAPIAAEFKISFVSYKKTTCMSQNFLLYPEIYPAIFGEIIDSLLNYRWRLPLF